MAPQPDQLPLDLLCCPACRGPLAAAALLSCSACGVEYPSVAGMPWLIAGPELALGEWRARVHGLLAALDAQARLYRAALDTAPRPVTRNRLKLLAAACTDHARRLRALLAPLGAESTAAAPELYRALGLDVPAGQGLTSYYANLHRDWSWGAAENEAAWGILQRALGSEGPGRTLLLGVGAGRLAHDLWTRRRPAALVAADVNPVFLCAVQRLFAGERLELYEFPVAPRGIEEHAILRVLQAPSPAPEVHLVFADATRAPFAAGAFDTVITPWFVDIVDDDFASFARRVNGWLRPGGRWISTGSLAFGADDPARRYALEEVLAILEESGFLRDGLREESTPYLCSPASRHGRVESVVTFVSRKQREVPAPPAPARRPSWLDATDQAVPLLPELQGRQLEMRVLAHVASLVDGRRSIRDIAGVLVAQRLMAPEEAEPAVRAFLSRLYDESRAGRPPSPL
jgi:uncharacterized protein YbaR (Trm112 family)